MTLKVIQDVVFPTDLNIRNNCENLSDSEFEGD